MKIKFSHRYNKMPDDCNKSMLLEVISVKLEYLHERFIEYDTRHSEGNYPLPHKGNYLLLLLITPKGQLWTTIRRSTTSKASYYISNIGKVFDIEIAGE